MRIIFRDPFDWLILAMMLFLFVGIAHAEDVGGMNLSLTFDNDRQQYTGYILPVEDELRYLLGDIQSKVPFELRAKLVLRDLRSFQLRELIADKFLASRMDKLKANPKEEAQEIATDMDNNHFLVWAADAWNQIKSSSPINIGLPPSDMVSRFFVDVRQEIEKIITSNGDDLVVPRVLKYLDYRMKEAKDKSKLALEMMSIEEGNQLLAFAKDSNFDEARALVLVIFGRMKQGSSFVTSCEIVKRTGRE